MSDARWDNITLRYKNVKNPGSNAHLTQVTLGLSQDEENFTKTLVLITQSQSSANWENGKNTTKVLDLQRTEERVTIDGFLATGVTSTTSFDVGDGEGSQTYTENVSASTAKDNLKNIFLAGGQCYMTYDNSTFSIHLEKLSIKSDGGKDGQEPLDNVLGYTVKLTAVKGNDL